MSRANTAVLDGLIVGYGARTSLNPYSGQVHTLGNTDKEMQIVVDFTNIDRFATDEAVDTRDVPLPVGAVVRSARLVVTEGFATLTSIVVGLKELDGTTNDDDGLVASTALALINTAGQTIEGAGAHVNGPALAVPSYVSLDVTGTAPASGQATLYVQYDMPQVSQDTPDVIVGEI